MPKIIFTSRYIKNPASSSAGKLIKYMGTREGVEKLPKLKRATSKRDVPLNDTAIEMILDLRKEFYILLSFANS